MTEETKPTLFSPGIGKRGMTALHYAAYCGDHPALIAALDAGVDPNAKDEYRGRTAAHWLADMAAVAGPRVEMLKALVARGADINAPSADGTTPLTLAREAGSAGGDALALEFIALGASDDHAP
jgi:ankyrin repeat protein